MSSTLLVGRRFGNDLGALRTAIAEGVPAVEADIRLFHGRLEVRHLKTVGPIPLLWAGGSSPIPSHGA